MTPEGKVKAVVKKMLEDFKCYQYWPVSNGMGAPALDCIVCHNGRFASIECKAPGKQTTARQDVTIKNINAAKGATFVVDGSGHSLADLRKWLQEGELLCT